MLKSEDVFYENESPEMMKELSALGKLTAHTPVYFKAEIIISFLKNHSLKNKWIEANPILAELMISGTYATAHIESLFESCRWRKDYLLAYENYIKAELFNPKKA